MLTRANTAIEHWRFSALACRFTVLPDADLECRAGVVPSGSNRPGRPTLTRQPRAVQRTGTRAQHAGCI